jgi:hypothetical protein
MYSALPAARTTAETIPINPTIVEGKSTLNRLCVSVTAHDEAFDAERILGMHGFLT